MSLHILLLVVVALSVKTAVAISPGAHLAVKNTALNTVLNSALPLVSRSLEGSTLDDVQYENSVVRCDFCNIRVSRVVLGDVSTNLNNAVGVSVSGLTLHTDLTWNCHVKSIGLGDHGTATIDLLKSELAANILFSVDTKTGLPSGVVQDSSALISSEETSVVGSHGKVLNKLYNALVTAIGSTVKTRIQTHLQSEFQTGLTSIVANLCQSYQKSLPMNDVMNLDLGILVQPKYANEFMELGLFGEFEDIASQAPLNLPVSDFSQPKKVQKPIYLNLDERFVQSWATIMHNHKRLVLEIGGKKSQKSGIIEVLQSTLAMVLPALKAFEKFKVKAVSVEAPKVHVSSEGINFNSLSDVTIQGSLFGVTPWVEIAVVRVTSVSLVSMLMVPGTNDITMSGHMDRITVEDLTVIRSDAGLDKNSLKGILQKLIDTEGVAEVNKRLSQGHSFKLPKGFNVRDLTLKTRDGSIDIECDVTYSPSDVSLQSVEEKSRDRALNHKEIAELFAKAKIRS
eukprot:195438_1